MDNCIYLRIDTTGTIRWKDLMDSLKHSHEVLRELDISLSGNLEGSIDWEIDTIKKESPLELAIAGGARSIAVPTPLAEIPGVLIEGLKSLSETDAIPERPEYYSTGVLLALRRQASFGRRVAPVAWADHRYKWAVLTEATSRAIDMLLKDTTLVSEGSIVGSLDSITVHNKSEFRVWDELSGRAVPCKFEDHLLGDVKAHLKSRVLVYGTIRRNPQSFPMSIEVAGIEPQPSESELPTIQEMSGCVEDITEGFSLERHLEELRGG